MNKVEAIKSKGLRRMLSLALVVSTIITTTACGGAATVDSPVGEAGDNSITISVITKDSYLDTAVKLFQEKNPGVTINVE